MGKYVLKRFIMSIITLWAIVTITFILMKAAPGNPFMKEGKMPESVYQNLQRKYGLDKPNHEQYIMYLKRIVKLDFGDSMKSRTEFSRICLYRWTGFNNSLGLWTCVRCSCCPKPKQMARLFIHGSCNYWYFGT